MALGACDTIASSDALDADSLTSAAAVYVPTYAAGATGPENSEFVYSDTPETGLVGFMGFSDGTVKPVRVRIASDESSAFLSINGGPEIAFDTRGEGEWSGPEGVLSVDVSGYWENSVVLTGEGQSARGYYGQQTHPEDLLTGVVSFSGSGRFSGETLEGGFGMNVDMDFASQTISGMLEGGYSDSVTGSGNFTGDVAGRMSGSFLAMSSDIAGTGVTGDLGFLGAFYDDGKYAAGGSAGTINGQSIGGDFSISADPTGPEGPL